MSKKLKTVKGFNELLEPADESVWQELRDAEVGRAHQTRPKTPNQERYAHAIETSTVTLCSGPAGTGKTFMACSIAARLLTEGKIRRIIITRPLVTCGKGIGFLPGEMREKVSPYLRPLLDAFGEFFGPKELEKLIREGVVELWPLETMRGASVEAFVICDEAQNAEYEQLHMLLTRFKQGSKVVVAGDATKSQTDLRTGGPNPFGEVIRRLSGLPGLSVVRLTRADNQRDGLVALIDERLADDNLSWYAVPCPKCWQDCWYQDGVVRSIEVIQCCGCRASLNVSGEAPHVVPWDPSGEPTRPRKENA